MMETVVSSAAREVVIGHGRPTVLIGERINPAGKKKLAEALVAGNMDIVCAEAIAQAQAGADIIDVNVGTFGVDEVFLLPKAVQVVMEAVDLPLCIDSAKPEALDAALRIYKGKALVNSVTGEERSLQAVLPLVKRYGAAVVGLVQDDRGVPRDAEGRVAIARKILEKAEAAGIPRQDVVIDCLATAVGADAASGLAAVEAIRRVKSELGVNVTLGASNISFGLPDRELLNNAFLAMVVAAGATALIVDVAKARPIILAADLLSSRDQRARRYIQAYRQRQSTKGTI
ncbi:MAG: pterin-binding protein [Chloroflexi bacterium]|nr:pterin-binding protein [Chloroflexota bacterium]MBM3166349.1 pterin-binding protein [Chloroflexota bacterium]MBM4451980.1 pterin-binding protein [Chloroflexota bacterium]